MGIRSHIARRPRLLTTLAVGAVALSAVTGAAAWSSQHEDGVWLTGDFHNHTFLTDGSNKEADVAAYSFSFGLDWFANSEHGGTSARDAQGNALPAPIWRWVSLKDASFPVVENLRKLYPAKRIIQAVEWNVPAGEHASVGIVGAANEPTAISDFEYAFDKGDRDTSRTGIVKHNVTHADAVAGAAWLQAAYPTSSYFLLNHPSRALAYSAADIRDFNNAAPTVAFGVEALPGHQKEAKRGGYGQATAAQTLYGGADIMIGKLGGLMDSLWGEGRSFWAFTNSDFHNINGDFWPGEYAKSYTFSKSTGYSAIVGGMRSGNSFAVEGDLINALDFSASGHEDRATMGDTLTVKKNQDVTITVRFKTPAASACQAYGAAAPSVDHVDLIAGDVTGKAQPGTAGYTSSANASTRVVARFARSDMKVKDGWYSATYKVAKADHNQYFRLRGTNQGVDVANQTANGEPLADSLSGANTPQAACSDIWFYSNPIFVAVR